MTDIHHGLIGEVRYIDDSTMNTLMTVDTPSGEVYIPYNEDFIREINDDDETIIMDLPEGLVQLNEKKP